MMLLVSDLCVGIHEKQLSTYLYRLQRNCDHRARDNCLLDIGVSKSKRCKSLDLTYRNTRSNIIYY